MLLVLQIIRFAWRHPLDIETWKKNCEIQVVRGGGTSCEVIGMHIEWSRWEFTLFRSSCPWLRDSVWRKALGWNASLCTKFGRTYNYLIVVGFLRWCRQQSENQLLPTPPLQLYPGGRVSEVHLLYALIFALKEIFIVTCCSYMFDCLRWYPTSSYTSLAAAGTPTYRAGANVWRKWDCNIEFLNF